MNLKSPNKTRFGDQFRRRRRETEMGVGGSILVEKNEPYSPGLLRSSGSSCLSKKSLEICTESLGSEAGSDDFSPSEETGDIVEEHLRVMKYCKKAAAHGAFPPLLPSLAREDGGSLQMQPRRENGRLVLEAVSVASHAYFQAHREHSRLCRSHSPSAQFPT